MTDHDDYANPKVWGPPLWTVMRCIANTYPDKPSKDKKYYTGRFYEGLKHVLPCESCAKHYSQTLHKYPVQDYLCCKNCLVGWVETVYSEIDKHSKK